MEYHAIFQPCCTSDGSPFVQMESRLMTPPALDREEGLSDYYELKPIHVLSFALGVPGPLIPFLKIRHSMGTTEHWENSGTSELV